ncbi:hypothetical protein PWT90_00622 [Aphanocladium album]|nr:hypothetical protein PWT90_00622 [Aphanocladium album]
MPFASRPSASALVSQPALPNPATLGCLCDAFDDRAMMDDNARLFLVCGQRVAKLKQRGWASTRREGTLPTDKCFAILGELSLRQQRFLVGRACLSCPATLVHVNLRSQCAQASRPTANGQKEPIARATVLSSAATTRKRGIPSFHPFIRSVYPPMPLFAPHLYINSSPTGPCLQSPHQPYAFFRRPRLRLCQCVAPLVQPRSLFASLPVRILDSAVRQGSVISIRPPAARHAESLSKHHWSSTLQLLACITSGYCQFS